MPSAPPLHVDLETVLEGEGDLLSLEPPTWIPDSHSGDCSACHEAFRCGSIFTPPSSPCHCVAAEDGDPAQTRVFGVVTAFYHLLSGFATQRIVYNRCRFCLLSSAARLSNLQSLCLLLYLLVRTGQHCMNLSWIVLSRQAIHAAAAPLPAVRLHLLRRLLPAAHDAAAQIPIEGAAARVHHLRAACWSRSSPSLRVRPCFLLLLPLPALHPTGWPGRSFGRSRLTMRTCGWPASFGFRLSAAGVTRPHCVRRHELMHGSARASGFQRKLLFSLVNCCFVSYAC